jgi:hypothetical protein
MRTRNSAGSGKIIVAARECAPHRCRKAERSLRDPSLARHREIVESPAQIEAPGFAVLRINDSVIIIVVGVANPG